MSNVAEYARKYAYYISNLLTDLDWWNIEHVIGVLDEARSAGKTVFLAGNGGSAATCSHFAEDLCYGTMVEGRRSFRAINLTDNVPYMTAVANDEGYENIFLGQLKALFNAGDILIVVSASGNSRNVIKAVEYVNESGGTTIGILGFDGGVLKRICHHSIHVKTRKGEYGPVEDIHLMLEHLITTYLTKG